MIEGAVGSPIECCGSMIAGVVGPAIEGVLRISTDYEFSPIMAEHLLNLSQELYIPRIFRKFCWNI